MRCAVPAWFAPHGACDLDALAFEAPPPGDAHGDHALLAMMFVCCHPALPVESALALALRAHCGFPIPAK
jgi:predicted RNA polymerase sigma factor